MRLIDADALIEEIKKCFYYWNGKVIKIIDNAPTIEPSEKSKLTDADNPKCDLISREDAVEHRPEYRNEDMLDKEKATYNKGWNDCADAYKAIIKALPSADSSDLPDIPRAYYERVVHNMAHEINALKEQLAGRPTGEWLRGMEGNGWNEWYVYTCDQCGYKVGNNHDDRRYNFCPNCGASMVKRVNGKEKEYLDKAFPHDGDGEWFDLTDALTKGSEKK